MYKPNSRRYIFLTLLVFIGFITKVVSQDNFDVVIMLNGDEKRGKVTGIKESSIEFKHSGEDLEYALAKSEINKIQFASGRIEVFNEVATSIKSVSTSSAAERKNKLAVLPVEYITNDPSINATGIAEQIQFECVNKFTEEAKGLSILDPMTINSILAQNDITIDNYKTIPPKDLASILGVEYIVYGAFNVINEGARTYGSSVTSYKDKEERDYEDSKRDTKSKGTAVTTNNSTTRISYDTHFDMNIYNDKGENIYSDKRIPFKGEPEGYKNSVKNLVQHSPFGSKYKQ